MVIIGQWPLDTIEQWLFDEQSKFEQNLNNFLILILLNQFDPIADSVEPLKFSD